MLGLELRLLISKSACLCALNWNAVRSTQCAQPHTFWSGTDTYHESAGIIRWFSCLFIQLSCFMEFV